MAVSQEEVLVSSRLVAEGIRVDIQIPFGSVSISAGRAATSSLVSVISREAISASALEAVCIMVNSTSSVAEDASTHSSRTPSAVSTSL